MSAPRACVIGWPVAHSRSPMIHGYWLESLGIDGAYDKAAVEPQDFPAFVRDMRSKGYVGGNVTIPHKASAAALCDRLTDKAKRLGSVNTLWFEGDDLWGDTTDGVGFLGALDQDAPGWDTTRGQALVIGAGGAAPPIVDALLGRGFARIIVANRTAEKAESLAGALGCEWAALADVPDLLRTTDLLVNATSRGMNGKDDLDIDLGLMRASAVVNDIVYVPRKTGLIAKAEARGLRAVGGLGMLLHQAVPGFTYWFGQKPNVTTELRALVEADIGRS